LKKIAISQSNYLPWRGYFEIINFVDEFIFYDEVQYTRRDWRNRNKILINKKPKWITIPLKNKGNYFSKISEMKVNNNDWKSEHLKIIETSYKKSLYFNIVFPKIYEIYESIETLYLYKINQILIEKICNLLEIKTNFINSRDIVTKNNNNNASKKILDICKNLNSDYYVTGPAAKNYLDEDLFYKQSIKVHWFNYKIEKEYQQFSENFVGNLSIIDSLMHCGFNKNKIFNVYQ